MSLIRKIKDRVTEPWNLPIPVKGVERFKSVTARRLKAPRPCPVCKTMCPVDEEYVERKAGKYGPVYDSWRQALTYQCPTCSTPVRVKKVENYERRGGQ